MAVTTEVATERARRVRSVGDAQWMPGVGLVRERKEAPAAPKDIETDGPISVSPRGEEASGGGSSPALGGAPLQVTFGISYFTLRPADRAPGQNGDALDASGLQLMLNFKKSWRLFWRVAIGFDTGGALGRAGGHTMVPDLLGEDAGDGTPQVKILQSSLWGHGRLGVHPFSFLELGGLLGYRLDHFKPDIVAPPPYLTAGGENQGKQDIALEYGGRAALHFGDSFGLEGAYFFRQGEYLRGRYLRVQMLLPSDDGPNITFWYERRLEAEGTYPASELATAGRALVYSMPPSALFGIGFGGSGW
jgi:hypothetical protein